MSNLIRKPVRGDGSGSQQAVWGHISGTLSDQTDLQAALDAKQSTSEKGQPNGYAPLDADNKLPSAFLPISAMEYKGLWNASTNIPALTSGIGNNGDFYLVSVAGNTNLNGITDWEVSDGVIFNGTTIAWEKIPASSVRDIDMQSWYTQASFAANVYTINAIATNPDAYYTGLRVSFIANNNNTGAVSVQIGSLSPIAVKDSYGDLLGNDIQASTLVSLIFDGTEFKVIKKKERVTQSVNGIIEFIKPDGVQLSLGNNTEYQFLNSTPLAASSAIDKKIIAVDDSVLSLSVTLVNLIGAYPNNFSFKLFYQNTLTDRVITFSPAANGKITISGVTGALGANMTFTVAAGSNIMIEVNRSGTLDWIISGAQTATETAAGIQRIATQSDVTMGTDDAKAITALKLQNKLDTGYVTLNTAQTITGLKTFQYSNTGSSPVSNAFGGLNEVNNSGTGTISFSIPSRSRLVNSGGGNVTSHYNYFAADSILTNGSTVTSQTAFFVDKLTSATNNTYIYLANNSFTIPSGNYAIYSASAYPSNFSGTITAPTFIGALTGNASTATILQTARTINGVSFNGSANITITSNTPNAVTFANTNAGVVSGTSFDGSTAITVDRNTLNVPSKTGTDASGTWGIAVTGNAGTATTLQTPRTINGVSFNGSTNINVNTVNSVTFANTNVGGATGSTFNGGSALTVDRNTLNVPSKTGADASGTWGISITGNSVTVGGFTPSQTAAVANRVVVADANGYVYNNYFNSTDNTQASGVTAVMVKAGDNFYRSGTAAAIATFISGQSMNIAGNATTATNVNYSPAANSIYGAATTVSTALTNYNTWDPLDTSEGFVCQGAPAGGTGSVNHPLTSIQTAINNAASAPNNYIIFPGTYVENLTIPSGTIVRLRSPHSRPACFLGSFESVVINGTLTVSSGTALIDGLQFSQATTISAVASGTITFVNCVFQNTVTVSGATGAAIIFKGCYFASTITSSSSNSSCQIQMTECTGNLNAAFNVTTDLSLLYIDNCVGMQYLDYRGNNLYINRLLSIGKNPGTGMSIKQRGNGGVGGGTFSIFYSNIRGDSTPGIDCNCTNLYYSSVLYNPGASSIVATSKITDSAF